MRWSILGDGLATLTYASAAIGQTIKFDYEDIPTDGVVWLSPGEPSPKNFGLTVGSEGIQISHVYLRNNGTGAALAEGEATSTGSMGTLPTGTSSSVHTEGNTINTGLIFVERRAESLQIVKKPFGISFYGIIVPFVELARSKEQMMYLEVYWNNPKLPNQQMRSTGRMFSPIVRDPATPEVYNTLIEKYGQVLSDNNPVFPEGIATSVSSTTTMTDTPSSDPTSAPSAETASAVTTSNSPPSPSGLNTGATAGIAVGAAVVGLLVIAAIVWFCCRRRRRSRDHVRAAPYGSIGASQSNVPDKEIPVMSDSPRSQHPEDGGPLHGRTSMRPSTQSPPSYDQGTYNPYTEGHTPYSEAPNPQPQRSYSQLDNNSVQRPYSQMSQAQPPQRPYSQTSHTQVVTPPPAAITSSSQLELTSSVGTGTRSPTPPPAPAISNRYAHLVEEGMTETEIWRLEDEERQLDMAIEQQEGRNSRAR